MRAHRFTGHCRRLVAVWFALVTALLADAFAASAPKRQFPAAVFSERVAAQYRKYNDTAFIREHFLPRYTKAQRVTAIPPSIAARNLTDDPLFRLGYLNLKNYAKGDGVTDDTQAILDALYEAYFFQLAVWIPAGTYLVSDSLECVVDRGPTGRFREGNGFFLAGDPDHRPVFRLADHAKGFQDPQKPRPIIEFVGSKSNESYGHGPRREAGAWLMRNAGISSVVIDCGRDNPGAIGFRCHGSQAVYAENLLVRAHGAFAGFKDLIGNAGFMANIEVQGGRFGLYLENGQAGSIAGCVLLSQTEAAIYQGMGGWPLTVTGFRIEQERGPVVRQVESSWKKDGNSSGHLSLVDGTIILGHPSPAFANLENANEVRGKDLYLRNVTVKGATPLIHSYGQPPVPPAAGDWSHVREYAHAGRRSLISIDGRARATDHVDVAPGPAPVDPCRRYALTRRELPSPLDADAVSLKDPVAMGEFAARGDGVTDDTAAFRHAIARYQKIFVPKGVYVVTGNIELKKDTVLFGVTAALSVIVARVGAWREAGNSAVFSTVDDAAATCMISQLLVYPDTGGKDWTRGWPLLDWRAGRASTVKNFYPDTLDWVSKPPDGPLIRISGHGGGRWYAFDGGSNVREKTQRTRPHYLHLLVDGTREPLIFFSHCAIHGNMDYCSLIRRSRNVEIYGLMDENTEAGYLKISDSRNILITGIGTNLDERADRKPSFLLEHCDDITLSVLNGRNGLSWTRIQDDRGVAIPGENIVAYYRRGRPFVTEDHVNSPRP